VKISRPKTNRRVTYQRVLIDFSNELSLALSANKLSNLECFDGFIEQYAENVQIDALVAADLLFCPNNYHNIAAALNYYAISHGIRSVACDPKHSKETVPATNNFLQQLFVSGELPKFLTQVLKMAIIPVLSDYVRYTKQKGLCTIDDLKNAEMLVLTFITVYAQKMDTSNE